MGGFDKQRAGSDKTYWYPNGLLNSRGKFSMVSENNSSLMRYVWHGCLLPTTVSDYAKTLNIPENMMPGETRSEINEIVGVFSQMKSSSTGFRDNTWPTLVELAGKIYNYATRAGGTEKRSYYANMLDWAKQYNRESNKDDPDEDLLEDLLSSVQGACKKQVKEINAFMQQSADMRDALQEFDNACHEHESKLDTIITAIQTKLGTLDGDGQGKYSGKIGELRKKIENNQAILEQEMKEYDKDVKIAATTPCYAWLGLLGLVTAATVAGIYGDKAARLEKAIKALKQTIEEEQGELKTMVSLEQHFQKMKGNLTGIRSEIEGAIEDLEKQEGIWESIRSRLEGLSGWVAELEKEVEPFLLEKADLTNIVDHWNELAKQVDEYRKTAFICPTPEPVDVNTYLKELQKKI